MEDPFSSRTAGFHLPQWSRVAHLETFNLTPNRNMQILPPIEGREQQQQQQQGSTQPHDATDDEGPGSLEVRRINYLEKSLNFLRLQHEEMLQSLQLEIERLRQENKDLQYRAVMTRKAAKSSPTADEEVAASPIQEPGPEADDLVADLDADATARESGGAGLQEQLRQVQRRLSDEVRQRRALQSLMEQQTERLHKENKAAPVAHGASRVSKSKRGQELRHRVAQAEAVAACPPELQLRNLRVRFDPLRIGEPDDSDHHGVDKDEAASAAGATVAWRAPSLMECELLVKQLVGENRRQAGDIARLKADVREVAYNGAYRPHRLPTLAVRQQQQQQQPPRPHLLLAGENVASRQLQMQLQMQHQQQQHQLPALSTALAAAADGIGGGGSRAADRRRRTQILPTDKH